MPSIPVATNPVQLSQVITQSALIQNNGPGTLYLADNASVTVDSYALRVTPGASVTWPANSELWGISDSTSSVGVLYGATGAGVSEVTVAGPLTVSNILSPVSLQGGAGLLYSGSVPLAGSQVLTITLPANVNGLVYPSVNVRLSIPYGGANTAVGYQVNYGPTLLDFVQGSVAFNDNAESVFFAQQTAFTCPWLRNTPITITLTNQTTTPTTATLSVWGVADAATVPVTDLSAQFGAGTFTMPASDNALLIPGSLSPFYIVIYPTGSTPANTVSYGGISLSLPAGASNLPFVFVDPGGVANAELLTTTAVNSNLQVFLSPERPNFNQLPEKNLSGNTVNTATSTLPLNNGTETVIASVTMTNCAPGRYLLMGGINAFSTGTVVAGLFRFYAGTTLVQNDENDLPVNVAFRQEHSAVAVLTAFTSSVTFQTRFFGTVAGLQHQTLGENLIVVYLGQ